MTQKYKLKKQEICNQLLITIDMTFRDSTTWQLHFVWCNVVMETMLMTIPYTVIILSFKTVDLSNMKKKKITLSVDI